MNDPIATKRRTREIQETYQAFTKKNYGQNFIIEPGVVQKIAQAAVGSKEELVVEIGPGIGALTQWLCEYADHVVAYEIDPRMTEILEKEIGCDHLDVILKDFLQADIDQEIRTFLKEGQKLSFTGNLPYYITTPILFKLFESSLDIERITVMMQKEVANRFLASENDKEYNALSVIWRYKCDVKKIMDVSRHVFWPTPRVDSTVLQFTFSHRYRVENEPLFYEFVKACFVQRRKTIYNNLQSYLQDKAVAMEYLQNANIQPNVRAQQCTLEDFIRLYEVNYESLCAR